MVSGQRLFDYKVNTIVNEGPFSTCSAEQAGIILETMTEVYVSP